METLFNKMRIYFTNYLISEYSGHSVNIKIASEPFIDSYISLLIDQYTYPSLIIDAQQKNKTLNRENYEENMNMFR